VVEDPAARRVKRGGPTKVGRGFATNLVMGLEFAWLVHVPWLFSLNLEWHGSCANAVESGGRKHGHDRPARR
jgi:hypothetical protein